MDANEHGKYDEKKAFQLFHDLNIGFETEWIPKRTVTSAWLAHAPFAFWIVKELSPSVLVELGSHNGFSYMAFCQAVERFLYQTRCFAIDTWKGDEHAGEYDQSVYLDLFVYNEKNYRSFSTLIKSTFDDARPYFDDVQIDLLHVDGMHTYEAAKADFENWKNLMSEKGIILFHDIAVKERGFGVWKLWREVSEAYPSFAFYHEYGLGVLAVGTDLPPTIKRLCSMTETENRIVRNQLSTRGEKVRQHYIMNHELQQIRAHNDFLAAQIREQDAKIHEQDAEKTRCYQEYAAFREVILNSKSWKVTAPLRGITNTARRIAGKQAGSLPGLSDTPPGTPQVQSKQHKQKTGNPPKKIVFIGGEGNTPGFIYRCARYCEAASAAGMDAVLLKTDEISNNQMEIKTAHVIVIWRAVWTETIQTVFDIGRRVGAKIVFDIDDLMTEPDMAKISIIDGIRSQHFTEKQVADLYSLIRETAIRSDFFFTTTEPLAMYLRRLYKPTIVLRNGFDEKTFVDSRFAYRSKRLVESDGLIRIGYAGGSRTHQRDFSVCANAVARILRENSNARLVIFKQTDHATNAVNPLLDMDEFPGFVGLEDQIEWREMVSLDKLPSEISRFDINLAPLELDNPFCEGKSELKFFEAALCGVCTVASPTNPFQKAIEHGITGFLAKDEQEWHACISLLISDEKLRSTVAADAFRSVLWPYGEQKRTNAIHSALTQVSGGRPGAYAFALEKLLVENKVSRPVIPDHQILFSKDSLKRSFVTVIIPLYNYGNYVIEAMESVKRQTLSEIDLIVIDDQSTDESLSIAMEWAGHNSSAFNRLIIAQNCVNAKLAHTRNVGFELSETPYVMPLDADNRLLPKCLEICLAEMRRTKASFVYPVIQAFGEANFQHGLTPYHPAHFSGENFVDAMALVDKGSWAAVNGYDDIQYGYEDYDFYCKMAEKGMVGHHAGGAPLAEYRVHKGSMSSTITSVVDNKLEIMQNIEQRHPWVGLMERTHYKKQRST